MKYKPHIVYLIVFILVFSLVLSGCSQLHDERKDGRISVYTTIYPLYDLASKIAGERTKVHMLVPMGAASHDYEPSPKDLIKVSDADLLIYNGSGYESWINDVLQSLKPENIAVLNVSEHVDLLSSEETGSHTDPHFWLDPLRAVQISASIRDAFIQADPEGKVMYNENYVKLESQLTKLHQEFEKAINQAQRKEIIVSHRAFGYLADRYGLQQISISGTSPSDEPSQKDLMEIISLAKAHHINYILFETMVSPKVAEVVRKQVGAKALTLNPIEGLTKEQVADGEDYFTVMRENLSTLKIALGSK